MEATRYIGGADGTRLPRQRVRLAEVFQAGAMVTIFLLAALIAPLLAGAIADMTGAGGVFVMVEVMYAITAGTVWFGPETQGLSLEEAGEGGSGTPISGGR